MADLHADYYRSPDGSEPVRDFLEGLDDEIAARWRCGTDTLRVSRRPSTDTP